MMFFKKKEQFDDIKAIDIHSHIIPFVDDGSKSIDESIEMARMAEANGITNIICTPHNKMNMQNESKEFIVKAVNELQKQIDDYRINVKLHVGNEVMAPKSIWMDHKFVTMNDTGYVLVEFDLYDPFDKMEVFLNNIQRIGYKPIIAHVERYECIINDYKNLYKLKDMGCLIQVNSNSVINEKNKKISSFVAKILGKELVDFIATDAHDLEYRRPIIRRCANHLYSKYNKNYVDELLYKNAQYYLEID